MQQLCLVIILAVVLATVPRCLLLCAFTVRSSLLGPGRLVFGGLIVTRVTTVATLVRSVPICQKASSNPFNNKSKHPSIPGLLARPNDGIDLVYVGGNNSEYGGLNAYLN